TEEDGATGEVVRGQSGCLRCERPEEVATGLARFWQEYASGMPAIIDYADLLEECSYEKRAQRLAEVFYGLKHQGIATRGVRKGSLGQIEPPSGLAQLGVRDVGL